MIQYEIAKGYTFQIFKRVQAVGKIMKMQPLKCVQSPTQSSPRHAETERTNTRSPALLARRSRSRRPRTVQDSSRRSSSRVDSYGGPQYRVRTPKCTLFNVPNNSFHGVCFVNEGRKRFKVKHFGRLFHLKRSRAKALLFPGFGVANDLYTVGKCDYISLLIFRPNDNYKIKTLDLQVVLTTAADSVKDHSRTRSHPYQVYRKIRTSCVQFMTKTKNKSEEDIRR